MRGRAGRRGASIGLNLTPLIDIVFLLLVFFMLTAHFVGERRVRVGDEHLEGDQIVIATGTRPRHLPVPGGVLIRKDGALLGAIGITGDSSDNDETCAVAAIEAQGLTAETG